MRRSDLEMSSAVLGTRTWRPTRKRSVLGNAAAPAARAASAIRSLLVVERIMIKLDQLNSSKMTPLRQGVFT